MSRTNKQSILTSAGTQCWTRGPAGGMQGLRAQGYMQSQ
jgi:hypothetical protein